MRPSSPRAVAQHASSQPSAMGGPGAPNDSWLDREMRTGIVKGLEDAKTRFPLDLEGRPSLAVLHVSEADPSELHQTLNLGPDRRRVSFRRSWTSPPDYDRRESQGSVRVADCESR